MDFKEFKEKYFGKSVDEIKDGLKGEKNFWKHLKKVQLAVDANSLAEQIVRFDKDFIGLFVFKKKYVIMLYILQNLTNIELIPEDEEFEDYNVYIEQAILELNEQAKFFKDLVEEIIVGKETQILQELYDIFKKGIPTIDEMKELQTSVSGLFKDESPEKLKTIESIMAFNDPTMNTIKNIIVDNNINNEVKKQILNNDVQE